MKLKLSILVKKKEAGESFLKIYRMFWMMKSCKVAPLELGMKNKGKTKCLTIES